MRIFFTFIVLYALMITAGVAKANNVESTQKSDKTVLLELRQKRYILVEQLLSAESESSTDSEVSDLLRERREEELVQIEAEIHLKQRNYRDKYGEPDWVDFILASPSLFLEQANELSESLPGAKLQIVSMGFAPIVPQLTPQQQKLVLFQISRLLERSPELKGLFEIGFNDQQRQEYLLKLYESIQDVESVLKSHLRRVWIVLSIASGEIAQDSQERSKLEALIANYNELVQKIDYSKNPRQRDFPDYFFVYKKNESSLKMASSLKDLLIEKRISPLLCEALF